MITIIDYGVGNIGSITNMLERIDQAYTIEHTAQAILCADALILPGVGAAGIGMQNLKAGNLDRAIQKALAERIPFLGICLGMQLLFDTSEENDTTCLGVISGTIRKFRMERKIPQIGWNVVTPNPTNTRSAPLFEGIADNSEFYFVNSFYPAPIEESITAATSIYGETFTSVIATGSIVATQFHPEKSGDAGLQFIKNFMKEYV